MNLPPTVPDLCAGPLAFRHDSERMFAGKGIIERHIGCEAPGLALGVDVKDPVIFHAAPRF